MKPLDHSSLRRTNVSCPQRVLARGAKASAALLTLSLLFPAAAAQAQSGSAALPQNNAARQDAARTLEPLTGRRVLVVLPLQTSQNWVANRIFTRRSCPRLSECLNECFPIRDAIRWLQQTVSTLFCNVV
jgi:hypothetical protein